ncbi:MAG: butyryl-CoA:acetate CoA-transferase [Lachnospiraceae bacterium]|nr:butyryl-CoA:acetate CoA-transferase [Lachnospiraceae bacterium]
MDYSQEYKKKVLTASDAAALVKSGDWVDLGMISNIPPLFEQALAKRKEELFDVKVRGGMLLQPLKMIEADPSGEHFVYNSWHLSGIERKYADQGLCHYIPMNYSSQPKFYRDFLTVNIACVCVTPMDKNGYFNLSLTNSSTRAMLEKADIVIVEVHEYLPWACGGQSECIHISQVDHIIEGEHQPFPTLPESQPTAEDEAIAALISPRIKDGSVLQLGIGGTPNAVGKLIAKSDVKDLGMHTEMLCDAYLELFKAGKLTNRSKKFDRYKGVWSFCLGSQELYDWVDHNPGLASCPVDYTNAPKIVAQHDNVVAINNCLEVDLYGQICAETVGTRQISGTGGQLDFLYGAFLSNGGQGFICLSSTYKDKKTGQLRSRIVPTLQQADVVTDPRSHSFYVVTEWGMVNLAGCSAWERAEKIISIAHPQFRDELIKDAEKQGIWRKSARR